MGIAKVTGASAFGSGATGRLRRGRTGDTSPGSRRATSGVDRGRCRPRGTGSRQTTTRTGGKTRRTSNNTPIRSGPSPMSPAVSGAPCAVPTAAANAAPAAAGRTITGRRATTTWAGASNERGCARDTPDEDHHGEGDRHVLQQEMARLHGEALPAAWGGPPLERWLRPRRTRRCTRRAPRRRSSASPRARPCRGPSRPAPEDRDAHQPYRRESQDAVHAAFPGRGEQVTRTPQPHPRTGPGPLL